jgi:formylmethanofuran dehydrogenase subunit D
MTTPTFGELIEKVKTTHNYTNDQAYAYLASSFFTLASDEDVVRVFESIGIAYR